MKFSSIVVVATILITLVLGIPQPLQAQDTCNTHCDCPQGDFCYKGTCRADPKMKVYCCEKLDTCPPGHWCVQRDEKKSICEESSTYECETACDCGPAHACLEIDGYDGKRCVKDVNDPWLPGPGKGIGPVGAEVTQGEDATYCCDQPNCHAGKLAYEDSAQFLCASEKLGGTFNFCGGTSCGSTCECELGESCVDTKSEPTPPPGKICGLEWQPIPGYGGSCVSNAMAEAFYGFKPSDLLPCCKPGCPTGTKCELGWQQGGDFLTERVIGTCGGSYGNGTCDIGEQIGDPDCAPPYLDPNGSPCGKNADNYKRHHSICGDGVCDPLGYTPENCMSCPADCGEAVNSDDDFVADCIDLCPNTKIPETIFPAADQLGKNRWAMLENAVFFTQAKPQAGSQFDFSAWDTQGCSCEQIIQQLGLGKGHKKRGCSTSVMLEWINQVSQ